MYNIEKIKIRERSKKDKNRKKQEKKLKKLIKKRPIKKKI